MLNINKVHKIIIRIKELDELIIKTEKAALKVINQENGLVLGLKLSVKTPKIEKEVEEDFPPYTLGFYTFSMLGNKSEKHDEIEISPSPEVALRMMQVYVNELNLERNSLINKLEKSGISL